MHILRPVVSYFVGFVLLLFAHFTKQRRAFNCKAELKKENKRFAIDPPALIVSFFLFLTSERCYLSVVSRLFALFSISLRRLFSFFFSVIRNWLHPIDIECNFFGSNGTVISLKSNSRICIYYI